MQNRISLLRSTSLDPGVITVGIHAVPRDRYIHVDSGAVFDFMRRRGRVYRPENGLSELGSLVEEFERRVLAVLGRNPQLSTINSQQLNR